MNIRVLVTDEREVKVVAAGFQLYHAAQIISCRAPRTKAATVNGAALAQARHAKEVTVRGTRRGGTGNRTNFAPFSISCVEERVDENVVGVARQVVRNFSGNALAGVDGSSPGLADLFRKVEPTSCELIVPSSFVSKKN